MDKIDAAGTPAAATPPAPQTFAEGSKTPQESGNEPDDLGYAPHTPQPGDKDYVPAPEKLAEKAPEKPPEKVEKVATGYGEKPIEAPPAAPEVPPVPDELDPAVEGIPKEEGARIKEFAKKNALTKEQVKAFADVRKVELKNEADAKANYETQIANEKQKVRATWDKELRTDPDFGGDNFSKNVGKAEKVLDEWMPNTKKALTERNSMLPPYVMRDLAKMAGKLYDSGEKLTQGDPTPEVAEKKSSTDEALEFYQ